MKNSIGRDIPHLPSHKTNRLYDRPFSYQPTGRMAGAKLTTSSPQENKLMDSLEQAIRTCGITDGMTLSFHHHFRNGDYIVQMVMDAIAKLGIKDITIAPSSLSTTHQSLIPLLQNGVITGVETSGVRGELGQYLTQGNLSKPVIIRSHGGRARAIESGELHIDVAFLGVPACDSRGNCNGVEGPSACGSLGYAIQDAAYADKVVAITDHLVSHPLYPISIPQTQVDYIVQVDAIGDPKGISSGALRYTKDPKELLIAEYAAAVIEHSGYFQNGYSLQLGSGGASMAVGRFMREKMLSAGIKGSFGVGGMTGTFADMLREGLFETMFDVQDFDIAAAQSLKDHPRHLEMSASYYANPHNRGAIVNDLDVVILSATEVDTDFNINVITDSNGTIMGASGGHCDTAAGAKLAVVVAPLLRGRLPMIRDKVHTVVTPGETVDVLVTDRGIAVNPTRPDLLSKFQNTKLPILDIHELQAMAYKLSGQPDPIEVSDQVVGIVEYRDGSVIDVIYKPV